MAFTLHEKENISFIVSDVLGAKHGFTRALGKAGDYPYSSVNDPEWLRPERQEAVRTLWQQVGRALALPEEGICFTRQVHETHIRFVTGEERRWPPLPTLPPDCDGLITDRENVPLCVFTADCVPVLFEDREAHLIAAVHSGWKGTVKDMMGAAVDAMTERGAKAENIRAAIGPAISKCCFQVGSEVKEAIDALLGADAEGLCPEDAREKGKYLADIKEANRRRLIQCGVRAEHIDVSPDCTMCRSDVYWSHRVTHGVRGTQASIIVLE